MKIGITTDVFPPMCGGSGWSAFDLARGLKDRGHEVRCLKLAPGGRGIARADFGGLEVIEWGVPSVRIPGLRAIAQGDLLTRRLRPFLVGWMRENRLNLVHAQHRLVAPATTLAAREAGIPSVLTIRDYWPVCFFTTSMRKGEFCDACTGTNLAQCLRLRGGAAAGMPGVSFAARSLIRREMRRRKKALETAAAVLVIGSFLREQVARIGLARQLILFPNYVDPGTLAAEANRAPAIALPDPPFLAFVGKITEEKGARELADVMIALGPGTRLAVAGDGPLAAFLDERARHDGWSLTATGWVDRATALAVVSRSRTLLFPSLWPEPLGRSILEAQALGVPVVAFDRGGPRDILIDGETGYLADTVARFAAGARRLLADADLAERLGRNGRERVAREFGREKFFERLETLYHEVAA